jgi:hypothetical protein
VAGLPNILKGNQSNVGSAGGARENAGREYRVLGTIQNKSGNKADGIAVPKTTNPKKCELFPGNNTTVTLAVENQCE